jgi:hypothetical protein
MAVKSASLTITGRVKTKADYGSAFGSSLFRDGAILQKTALQAGGWVNTFSGGGNLDSGNLNLTPFFFPIT